MHAVPRHAVVRRAALRRAPLTPAGLSYAVLSEPKIGSSKAEYEDAWFVSAERTGSRASATRGCTVAIADGASESMLAGAWADRLTRAVGGLAGRELGADVFAERICAAAARWPAHVDRYLRRRERIGRPIAWYEESKLEQGAYATLLGVSFRWNPESESQLAHSADGGLRGTWSAAALGDACGFHVRDARLAEAFPLERSADFDTSPPLAGTRAPDRELIEARTVARHGTWLPGDVFYLATDAAAQWFLAEAEDGREPWREIDEVCDTGTPGDARAWLDKLRTECVMRNDDVTIVRCRLDANAAH